MCEEQHLTEQNTNYTMLVAACFLALVALSMAQDDMMMSTTAPTSTTDYPTLDDSCYTVKWEEASEDNNWGNCVAMTTDATHRYITANEVPDYYVNPYCPISIGGGYCTALEISSGKCVFTELVCGGPNYADNGEGSTYYGDVWVASQATYKIKLEGDPTQSDRPASMYDASAVDAEKSTMTAAGVAINGVGILGPSDAGDLSIDGAGFQLACGGHVTPPLGGSTSKDQTLSDTDTDEELVGSTAATGEMGSTPSGGGGGGGPSGPPMYHYHKSPDCLLPFRNSAKEVSIGGTPYEHAGLIGYAVDGFGIYGYQDVGGAAPIVDQCGGHFGPVDTDEVKYHYHSRTSVPYHLACQGPSLGKCADTQTDADFCHPGCGYDICVQPGTDKASLEEYVGKWDPTWLKQHTVNDFVVYPKGRKRSMKGRKRSMLNLLRRQ